MYKNKNHISIKLIVFQLQATVIGPRKEYVSPSRANQIVRAWLFVGF